jgi:NAD(P)H dehydrogenase (quinone)
MSKIVVTGANGQLGALVIQHLLNKGVAASSIIGIVRNPEKAAALTKFGIEVRTGDYDLPASLETAFTGAAKLLFVSASSMDNTLRVRQHASVVEAARNAGVGHIVYTSLSFAEKMKLGLENVHLATEYMIRTTDIPYTFLRNGFYLDLLVNESLKGVIASNEIITSVPSGAMNYVTRNDLALAAATVLTSEGHDNRIYELTSPTTITYDEFAAILSDVSGKPIRHRTVTPDEVFQSMVSTGVPAGMAGFMVHGVFAAVEDGQFGFPSEDLVSLIGDSYTSVKHTVSEVLKIE